MTGSPQRILQVCETSGTGGAENVVLNIASGLDPDRFRSTVALPGDGWLNESLTNREIGVLVFRTGGSYDTLMLRDLCRIIRENKIDLVHAHLPDANAYAAMAGFLTRVPVIITYHGRIDMGAGVLSTARAKLKIAARLSHTVVSVSDFVKDRLIVQAGFSPKKIRTVYNGTDWSQFDSQVDRVAKKQELSVDPDAPLIGMVANLAEDKGFEYFVRAARIIVDQLDTAQFLIMGEGPRKFEEMINSETERLGLTDNIHMLGYREDVPEILPALDLFMLSSVSEGLSLATIESMGVGTPVVVTASGGPQEIVTDCETGYLVPIRDEKALAEKALKILTDPQKAKSMTEKARTLVRSRFSVDTMIWQYEQMYQQILNGSPVT